MIMIPKNIELIFHLKKMMMSSIFNERMKKKQKINSFNNGRHVGSAAGQCTHSARTKRRKVVFNARAVVKY
jgi:hypothetical protein